jgi:hypothetical protein
VRTFRRWALGGLGVWFAFGCSSSASSPNIGQTDSSDAGPKLDHFSFFVTSLRALQELSGSQNGFGGDLRFGETGEGAGLRGADSICATIAEKSMPGARAKTWRAFLSASTGGDGEGPVHAIDRIGKGPWYDRIGRVVALTKEDLQEQRPRNADPAIAEDLPNEEGIPNHAPDPSAGQVDNHDVLTGSTVKGLYYGDIRSTCLDWTSVVGSDGTPRVGHSWSRNGFPGIPGFAFPEGGLPPGFPFPGFPGLTADGGGGLGAFFRDFNSWASALTEAGCAPGVNLVEMGPPNPANPTVGSGGGYGAFYCFALSP